MYLTRRNKVQFKCLNKFPAKNSKQVNFPAKTREHKNKILLLSCAFVSRTVWILIGLPWTFKKKSHKSVLGHTGRQFTIICSHRRIELLCNNSLNYANGERQASPSAACSSISVMLLHTRCMY